MTQQDNSFESLPPLAKAAAQAMEKPYRPSRMPWLMAGGITLVLHIIFFSVKWANGPTEAQVQDLMKPDPRRPVVVYQSLRAPVVPPLPRVATPAVTESVPDASSTN